MKGKIRRILSLAAVCTLLAGTFNVNLYSAGAEEIAAPAAAVQWLKGWTGSADASASDYSITENGTSIQIQNMKVNNGKFTDGEDSVIYYAAEVDNNHDFKFTAKVSIDSLNTIEESSNPHQSSVGIGVLDELFNKTDDKKYTNSVFLGSYAASKNDNAAFYAIRRDSSETKTVSPQPLSSSFANTGEKLGEFELSISKSGDTYTLSCGENTETFDMKYLSDRIYPCLYAARNANVTFSDVNIEIQTRKVKRLLVSGDFKTEYKYGDELDLSGITVSAVYDDAYIEEIKDYSVRGYNPYAASKQTVVLSKGAAEYRFEVNVSKLKCTQINIIKNPARTEYNYNTSFSSTGMEVEAVYDNGTTEILSPEDYFMRVEQDIFEDGYVLDKKGSVFLKIYRKDSDGVFGNGIFGSVQLKVNNADPESLSIERMPLKSLFYIGDELDLRGLEVKLNFENGSSELLKSSDYAVQGFDSASVGEKTLSVIYKNDMTLKASFTVQVNERKPEKLKITSYPKTTYDINEEFDEKGLEVSVVYDNGDVEPTADYTIDKAMFSSAAEGKTGVNIVPLNSDFEAVRLNITVAASQPHYWRKAIFGQSASADKQQSGAAGVTAENYGTVDGTINVKAWEATGKITGDHDGIVYYYTRINPDNNFTLSADVTVNKYLEHNNDDTKRNGQEAFGLMARDVVPLLDAAGERTIYYSQAQKDEQGVAVTQEKAAVFASNAAIAGGYSGTGWPNDSSAATYEKNTQINRINLYVRKGVEAPDGGGDKVGPNAISSAFPAEGSKYRITLSRVNGGIYAKCYNYQTEETMDSYVFEDNLLTVQNSEDAYVGFFAARWADIDVSDVEFYESSRDTDMKISSGGAEVKAPELLISSSQYSASEKYELLLDAVNGSGRATVTLDGKVVIRDKELEKGKNRLNISLNKNSCNRIAVIFTPDDVQRLTSYDNIYASIDVYNKRFNSAQRIYVSPQGSFEGDGTEDYPYDIDTAIGFLSPGQTIILKSGVYNRSKPLNVELGNDGTADAVKTVTSEEGGRVIFDMGGKSAGAVVTGNYWHFKGLEFRNSGENLKCFHLGGSNCVVENSKFYNNGDMGLQISRTYMTDDYSKWPANNLILNCEAYNNCDPSMINADGFGAKLTVGDGNVFRGCSSHHNVDDGWDLYTKVNSGAIGAVTIENCESYKNGFRLNEDGSEEPYGSGGHNGFKLGGENVAVAHILRNCRAYGNDANGVTSNSNPTLVISDVVSYDNGDANFRLYSDKPAEYNYTVSSCISFNGGEVDLLGTINRDEGYTNASTVPLISESNYFIRTEGSLPINSSGRSISDIEPYIAP